MRKFGLGAGCVLMGLAGCAGGPSDAPGSGILQLDGVNTAIRRCEEQDNGFARTIVATDTRGMGVGVIVPHDGGPISVSLFVADAVLGPCDAAPRFTTVGDTWVVEASCFGTSVLVQIRSCELLDD